ncbi:vacuolar protein sorting-associated protein 52, putative, partial [Hepatocystis sp. ex Piliocolobus tephrosceles]
MKTNKKTKSQMEYDEVSDLIKKFKNDKHILRMCDKLYKSNNCKFYRSIKLEDLENWEYTEEKGCYFIKNDKKKDCVINKNSNDEHNEFKNIMNNVNKIFNYYCNEALNKYVDNKTEFININKKIDQCNNIYTNVNNILNEHLNEVKIISSDIISIQKLSENMDYKLNNRKIT